MATLHGIWGFFAGAALLAAAGCGGHDDRGAARGALSYQDDGIGTPEFASEGGATPLRTTRTIPYWSSSFSYAGVTYPYTMVGSDPATTTTATTVDTALIPVRFVFADGRSLDGSTKVDLTLQSPLFADHAYTSGTTQFGDAVQRATFWSKVSGTGWGVRLGAPSIYPTQTIAVPANQAVELVGRNSGQLIGLMSGSWFSSHFKNLLSQLHVPPTTVPILATYNIFLYVGDPSQCCILGYHGASSSLNGNGSQAIQTYIFASWTDPGIFRASGIQDIHALSHEVAEWLNDPFVHNPSPPWTAPGYGCSNVLEVGDPLVGFDFPVTVNGRTYHPQTDALLQWFARESPSSAIGGAYSYPDTGVLTSPSPGCP